MAKKARKGVAKRSRKPRAKSVGDPQPIKVTVSVSAPTAANRVFLDAREFPLNATGTGHLLVPRGAYTLFWVVYGGDGQKYTIKLSAPGSAKWESGPRTMAGDHDIGNHYPVEVE